MGYWKVISEHQNFWRVFLYFVVLVLSSDNMFLASVFWSCWDLLYCSFKWAMWSWKNQYCTFIWCCVLLCIPAVKIPPCTHWERLALFWTFFPIVSCPLLLNLDFFVLKFLLHVEVCPRKEFQKILTILKNMAMAYLSYSFYFC